MRQILFVDDDLTVLDGIRRTLYPLRAEWQTSFANSGPQALELLSKKAFDVVVTDIRMPEMDGTELLRQVRDRYPDAIRVILSGQADDDLTVKAAAIAHQYLAKPCDTDSLRLTITRANALKDILTNKRLRALIGKVGPLPSIPALYTELVRELESPHGTIESVAILIARDTAMTARIVQLANSAFFGVRYPIRDLQAAIIHLGFDTLRALTFTAKVFSQFNTMSCSKFSLEALSSHCVTVGTSARRIAQLLHLTKQEVGDSLLAGLIHDIGKLVLVENLPAEYSEAIRIAETTTKSFIEAECEVFGTTHAEVGAYLLWLWGLPNPVIEAVAYHHLPLGSTHAVSPLTAVHIANVVSHAGDQRGGTQAMPELNREYLDGLELPSDLLDWQALLLDAGQESPQ